MKKQPKVIVKHNVACTVILVAMGLGFGVNAMVLQKGKHPAPLLASSASGAQVSEIRLSVPIEQQSAQKKDPLVIAVQSGLREMGYYKGPIDGIAGEDTKRSIVAYQQQHALEMNGKINTALVAHMRAQGLANSEAQTVVAQPTLSPPQADPVDSIALLINDTPAPEKKPVLDETVRTVQAKLKQAGFDPGPVDGMLGNATTGALRAFQEANGLPVTGQVDADVLVRLFSTVEGRSSSGG